MASFKSLPLLFCLSTSAVFSVFLPTCGRPTTPDSQFALSLSIDTLMLLPGKSVDVTVKIHTTAQLDAPVILTLRSPGDEPLPDGITATFDPPAVVPAPGQDASTKLHLVAQTQLSEDSYPLVVFARSQDQEADAALTLNVSGTESNWHRPIATPGTEQIQVLGADHSGGVFIGVNTTGAFAGLTNQGNYDGYVLHYRQNGAVSYVQPLATVGSDVVTAMAVDSDDSVYVAGVTYGAFPAQSNQGKADNFLAKISSEGKLAWVRQFGTPEVDQLTGVAVAPDGTVYATGITEGAFPGQTFAGGSDVFLASFAADGTSNWIREFGTDQIERTNAVANTQGAAVTVDAGGNVYVCGSTQGAFPGATSQGLGDGFVASFKSDGTKSWLQQIGSYGDDALVAIVAHPNGQVYAAGWARGPLGGQVQMGGQDGVIVAYKSDGTRGMVRQFGTSYADVINGIGLLGEQIYVAGSTRGSFPGQTQAGVQDAFFARIAPEGSTLWLRQLGTSQSDSGAAIVGSGKYLYVGGITFGDFDTDLALTESDGFLNQYPSDQ